MPRSFIIAGCAQPMSSHLQTASLASLSAFELSEELLHLFGARGLLISMVSTSKTSVPAGAPGRRGFSP